MKKLLICLFAIGLMFFSNRLLALDFASPLDEDYVVTSPFGYRKAVMGGMEDGLHRGIDMVPISIVKNKKANVKVLAAEDGVVYVIFAPPGAIGKNGEVFKGHPLFGGMIILYHGDACYTLYGHLKEIWIHSGDKIKKGQMMGLVGSTGQSTGPHLHFEIDFDPAMFLAGDTIKKLSLYPPLVFPDLYKK